MIINDTNRMKYIGVRSCICPPDDDPYMGSSDYLDEAMLSTDTFRKIILATYPDRQTANEHEIELLECVTAHTNPDYYNRSISNIKFSNYGRKHSIETRVKMSVSATGVPCSPETRKKLSVINMGKKLSKETCAKMSASQMGHEVSKETRNLLSSIHTGREISKETCAKMSASRMGKAPHNKGVTNKDYYGEEKAVSIKEKEIATKLAKTPLEKLITKLRRHKTLHRNRLVSSGVLPG